MARLGLEDPIKLLDSDWTSGRLIALLEGVDFTSWLDYEDIVLEASILPVRVRRRLDEETIKYAGEVWRIHRYDPDPFPSLPHAHNVYEGTKLDLRDGTLYRKHQPVGQLGYKALVEFRRRVKRTPLPSLSSMRPI
jgi:hypothetical protein